VLAAVSCGYLVAATPALAGVTLGPQQIVLSVPGAGAVITRSPFAIAYTDGSGRTVLAEVPAGAPAGPSPIYAPLSFLVGSDEPSTFPGGRFTGDLRADALSGTEYSAQEVISAAQEGEGVRLTLSTDDPSGRQLVVTLRADGPGAIRLEAEPNDPSGVAAMADSFSSSPSEAFYGFGGRHNALDQHGQTFYNWSDQENIGSSLPNEVESRELEPSGPQGAYYVQSSFISDAGYGFMLDRDELSQWRMDSDRPTAWQTSVAAPALDYVVAPGDVHEAISTLTALAGRQPPPPQWALGPIFDQEGELGATAAEYQHKFEQSLHEFRATGMPVSAYRLEDWQILSRAQLESDIGELQSRGIHPLVYFRPFVGERTLGQEEASAFTTALTDGYVARNAEGNPYIYEEGYGSPAALIDFTNPAAVSWWQGRIEAALEMGADGFMLDFGEQVQPGMRFSDGSTGAQMHNRYPVLYDRVTREAVTAFERSHPGRSIFFYTRSGYSGTPGSAAYAGGNFPGDETTDWSQASGLASLTRDMLNRSIGGAYGYTTDIGGYWDAGPPPTTRELLLRWAAWAALSPLFRLHGALVGPEHAPWTLGPHTTQIYDTFARLHTSAAALILSLWQEAEQTGIPITRPLYLEYPEDPMAAEQDQEWMLGPNVLVAPVIREAAAGRAVYFPTGCWHSPASGQQVEGPASVEVQASITELPFFFRCGTVPFRPPAPFSRHLHD
jgi:alpha-glucosidase (family GH31 glycosyl hydrolase)